VGGVGEIRRTVRGRVVYDRRIHKFRWTDLRRIAEGLEDPRGDVEKYNAFAVLYKLLLVLTRYVPGDAVECADVVRFAIDQAGQQLIESPQNPFGGGEFGGGGASGDFWKPFDV